MGRTFQLTSIFKQSTVLENVMIGKSLHASVGVWDRPPDPGDPPGGAEDRERAREILSFVGLGDKENRIAAV